MQEDAKDILIGLLHAITVPLKQEREELIEKITELAKTLAYLVEAKANPYCDNELDSAMYPLIDDIRSKIAKKKMRLEEIDRLLAASKR